MGSGSHKSRTSVSRVSKNLTDDECALLPVVQEITKIRCIDIKFVRIGLSHYSDDQTKVFCETVKECKTFSAASNPEVADDEEYYPFNDGFTVCRICIEGNV
jgi:hypothetical protein